MKLENICVEFYDCAGQVDYGGMHQVFLTQRALFLLVWDIQRCSGLSADDLDNVSHMLGINKILPKRGS